MRKHKTKKNKQKKLIILVIFFLLIAVGLIVYYALQNNKPLEKTIKKIKPEPVKKLTIIDEDSNARPIAVMIDNNVGTETHAGLQESYINYEIIVEGGLTRIMAIFKDKDIALIGPVRSSRHYFLDYALESDCIYTHYGWSTFAQNDIKALGVNNINGLYDSEPFWRDSKIAAPHNVFTSIEKIYTYAKAKNYETVSSNWKLLNYTTDNVELNTPIKTKTVTNEDGTKEKVKEYKEGLITANSVAMQYSNYQQRSYTYDAERKVYLRFMNGDAHIDKITREQLNYKNLIIEKVENSTLDSYGRQDLDTVGSGEGYYITNGYASPIYWTKSSRSAKTKYTYSDGKEIKVNDGNTFVQVVPTKSDITIN